MLKSLENLTVIEVGTTVVAPYTAQTLGTLGAEVVKVEHPAGDPFRNVPLITEAGMSGYFAMCNCEKRSISIDLKSSRGLDILLELVQDADVLIENFIPGTADRLGFGYETVSDLTDDIIYCSISGYGQESPWSTRPGFDPILQGNTGLMSTTGERNGPPVRLGVAVIDLVTANWAVIAILNALRDRRRTGEGHYIDMSMHDVGMSMLTKKAATYLISGENPERLGTEDSWAMPYGAYEAKDGRRVMIGTPKQSLWEDLCRLIGRPELIEDDRFLTNADRVENREKLNRVLEPVFRTKTRDEWVEILEEEIPAGAILTIREALSTEQVEASEPIREFEGDLAGVEVLNPPLRTDGERAILEGAPPWLGEHTEEILRELGYSAKEVDSFLNDGVVVADEGH